MEWFKLNLGRHMGLMRARSLAQEGCYMRMLTTMYAHQRHLPPEPEKVFRMIGAKRRAEREAAEQVLSECFERRDDGWHDEDVDAQIANFQRKRDEGRERRARRKENAIEEQHLHAPTKGGSSNVSNGYRPGWN